MAEHRHPSSPPVADRRPAGPRRSRSVVGYRLAVLVAVAIGMQPLLPPDSRGEDSPTAFSARGALAHISIIASEPHPVGSLQNKRVREYITSELEAVGVVAELQAVSVPDYYGGSGGSLTAVNVIVRIPGTASTGAVAVVGHYDSFPTTPGANDNGSAVAIMLEMARILTTGSAARNDIMLLFTDGEEPAPRFGSTAFVQNHRWADDIRFFINLETIGSAGPSLLTGVTGPNHWVIDRYLAGATHPAAFSFITETTDVIGGSNSDFASFRDAGLPGIELAYAHGSPIYHTPGDQPGRVSGRSLHQHGSNALNVTRHVAGLDLSPPPDDTDLAYFTVPGSEVISYPARWNLLVAVAAGLLLIGAALKDPGRRRPGGDTAVVFGATVGVAGLATLLWMLLAGWRNTMGIVESYGYLLALAGLAIGGRWALLSTVGQHRPVPSVAGVATVWWALGMVTALAAPPLSYVFVIPAFGGAVALLARHHGTGSWPERIASVTTVTAAVVLMVPVIDFFFQFAQPRPGNPDSEVLATFLVPIFAAFLLADLVRSLQPR